MTVAIVCSFSTDLDDVPYKHQSDALCLLRALNAQGRFSIFDATKNPRIALTMTKLLSKGLSLVKNGVRTDYGLLAKRTGGDYPWTNIELTDSGRKLLADFAGKDSL